MNTLTTDSEINIAVAKLGGRASGDQCEFYGGPDGAEHCSDCPCNGTGWIIPDFVNSLDAVRAVTMLQSLADRKAMRMIIYGLTDQMSGHFASARVECEALLRVQFLQLGL